MLVKIENFNYSIANKSLVKNACGEVHAGEILAIVGGNGAGKSSLLKAIAKQLPEKSETDGSIVLQDKDIKHISLASFSQQVSYLPQQSELHFPLSVSQVINLGALPFALKAEQEKQLLEQALTEFDLLDFAQRDYRSLSGGEQKRTQLARSWLQLQNMTQALWLVDEPSNNLDLHYQQLFYQQAKKQAELGHAVVLVLHDLNAALQLADKVWLMADGQIKAAGVPDQVLNQHNIAQYFNVTANQLQHLDQSWLLIDAISKN